MGPGLPLGFGVVSTPWPSALLLPPGLGPGTPFLFEASESPEGVVASGAGAAAGVDAPSEALSADEAGAVGAVAIEVSAVVAAVAPAAAVLEVAEEESGEAEAGLVLVSV